LRGSIGLPDGFDDLRLPASPGLEPIQPIGGVDHAEPAEAGPVAPLGGLGDEAPARSAVPPLGGLGDEPSALGEAEAIIAAEPEIVIAPPTRIVSATPLIHTALLPEPHDLDPFVPIGFRLGSFILFPEAEIGADLTNNVLDTKFGRQLMPGRR
jgi:hypothetical protein